MHFNFDVCVRVCVCVCVCVYKGAINMQLLVCLLLFYISCPSKGLPFPLAMALRLN